MNKFLEILGYNENDIYIYDNKEQVLNDIQEVIRETDKYFENYDNLMNFYNDLSIEEKELNKYENQIEYDKYLDIRKKILAYTCFMELFGDIFKNQNAIDNFKILVFMEFVIERIEFVEFIPRYKGYTNTELIRLLIFIHNYNLINLKIDTFDNEKILKDIDTNLDWVVYIEKYLVEYKAKFFNKITHTEILTKFNFEDKLTNLTQLKNILKEIYRNGKGRYIIQYFYDTFYYHKNSKKKYDKNLIKLINEFERIEIAKIIIKD